MPISILRLAQEGEGASLTCSFKFDSLEDIDLASPANVEARVYNLSDDGKIFQAIGQAEAKVARVCDRCLKEFDQSIDADLEASFVDQPGDEEWPIINNEIDLQPIVREAILLNLPVKSLCAPDCAGINNKTRKDSNGST